MKKQAAAHQLIHPSTHMPRGKFEDEITRDLKHTGAGILSMVRSYLWHQSSTALRLVLTLPRSLPPSPYLTGQRRSQHKRQSILPHPRPHALAGR